MDYKGKKVLVTGGASGIGREIALEYARAGALVIVADKDYEGDRFVRGELRPIMPECCFFHCDLALSSACENLMQSIFEQFDDLDIIINNAGVSQFCSLWEETVEHWDYVLNSNQSPGHVPHQPGVYDQPAQEGLQGAVRTHCEHLQHPQPDERGGH